MSTPLIQRLHRSLVEMMTLAPIGAGGRDPNTLSPQTHEVLQRARSVQQEAADFLAKTPQDFSYGIRCVPTDQHDRPA